jgi:hypothetical protein
MAELVQVTEGYQKVLEENRRLYNEVQDLKGELNIFRASRRLPFYLSQARDAVFCRSAPCSTEGFGDEFSVKPSLEE